MCSHELFSLDLTQQMHPELFSLCKITPQETFLRFLYPRLRDCSVMLTERILMRPDAAKCINGNARSRRGLVLQGG